MDSVRLRTPFVAFLLFCSFCCAYSELPLRDKVGQVFIAPLYERELTEEGREFLRDTRLGNAIYFGFANGPFDKAQLAKLSQDVRQCIIESTGIPPLLAIDQEGKGFNQLKEGFTRFSSNTMGSDQAYRAGQIIGQELREAGITTDLAPVVDVVVRPGCPLHYRSFGDNPEQVTGCAREMIKGLHESGIHAVLKHFPGLGDTSVDSHRGLPLLHKSLAEMEALELKPFMALKGEADAIMVAHLLVPSVDPERCASLSPKFVNGILREKIGFDKVVICDSLVMKGVLGEANNFEEAVSRLVDVAVEAFLAGCDLLILAKLEWANFKVTREQNIEMIRRVMEGFAAAVESGAISEERLDRSLHRIYRLKGLR